MSTGRMKDQKDYDLEQIVCIVDQAFESDDQRIKDALRALMTITVLCTAEHPDQAVRNGPFARLLEDYNNLARRLSRLEDELHDVRMRMPPPTAAPYTPPTPYVPPSVVGPWIGTDPNGPKSMWGPSYTSAGNESSPIYKSATGSSTMLAEDFLRELQERK